MGTHRLAPNTPNQLVSIFVTGGDEIAGVNFAAQVEDGFPDVPGSVINGPDITGVDLEGAVTPTIFTGNNTVAQNPGSAPQAAFRSMTTQTGTVIGKGLFVTLTIDTTGLQEGDYQLKLGDTVVGPTRFLDAEANTLPATITDGLLTIALSPQTITVNCPDPLIFDQGPVEILASADSGLPVELFVVGGPGVLEGNRLSFMEPGSVTLRAIQAGDAEFAAVSQECVVVGRPKPATVSLKGLNHVYDGDPKMPVAVTEPPDLEVSFTFNGSLESPLNAGPYEVVATVSDVRYAGSTVGLLEISKAAQTIDFPALEAVVFGQPSPALGATASSGLDVTYRVREGKAEFVEGDLVILGAGKVFIEASQEGDDNYEVAEVVEQLLGVQKAPAQILLSGLSHAYDGEQKGVAVTTEPAGLTVEIQFNGLETLPVEAGEYMVTGEIVEANYLGKATSLLTISKVPQTIEVPTFSPTLRFGSPAPSLAASASSGLPVSVGVLSGPAAINGGELEISGLGEIVLRFSQDGTNNVEPAEPVEVRFEVLKGIATIEIVDEPWIYDGEPHLPVIVTEPPNLETVVFTAGIEGFPVDAGEYLITVQIMDPLFDGEIIVQMEVEKRPQQLMAGFGTREVRIGELVSLGATLDSELAIEYELIAGPARLQEGGFEVTGLGEIVIRASQPGDGNHFAAEPIVVAWRSRGIPPRFLEIPDSRGAVVGEQVVLEVVCDGNPKPTLQWFHQGISVPGAMESSLVIDRFSNFDAGEYIVVASNGVGDPVVSEAFDLTVLATLQPATLVLSRTGQFEIQGAADGLVIVESTDVLAGMDTEWTPITRVGLNDQGRGFLIPGVSFVQAGRFYRARTIRPN